MTCNDATCQSIHFAALRFCHAAKNVWLNEKGISFAEVDVLLSQSRKSEDDHASMAAGARCRKSLSENPCPGC